MESVVARGLAAPVVKRLKPDTPASAPAPSQPAGAAPAAGGKAVSKPAPMDEDDDVDPLDGTSCLRKGGSGESDTVRSVSLPAAPSPPVFARPARPIPPPARPIPPPAPLPSPNVGGALGTDSQRSWPG